MASDPVNPTTAQAGPDSMAFTLQVISPSVGVPQPLSLQGLPAGTTIRQLKERIRNAVNAKPNHQAQRLIHRGRLLARDDETLLEVFGEEALRSTEHQTLHLVLRDLSDGRTAPTPNPPLPATNQIPVPNQLPPGVHPQPQAHIHHQHHLPHVHAQPQVRIGGSQFSNVTFGFPQAQMSQMGTPMNLPPGYTPQQFAQHQRQWMAAMNAQMGVNQNQRDRAAAGLHGIQDMPNPNTWGTPGSNTPGRTASPLQPDATRTVVREGVGPNGQQWRITVNESVINPLQRSSRTGSPLAAADVPGSWAPPPRSVPTGGSMPGNDMQNIFRTADAGSATRAMTDAMRRNASNPSLANLASSQSQQPVPPGVTTPFIPSRNGSATGTPDPSRAAGRTRNVPAGQPQAQPSSETPEVYILSSPTGPRALLLNSSLETYFSPTPRPRAFGQAMGITPQPLPATFGNTFNMPYMVPQHHTQPQSSSFRGGNTATTQASGADQPQPPPAHPQGQAQHGLPQPQPQPQIGHAVARPDNPQIQAVRIAQIWPHIWLVIRLGLFIWWFTSPTSSWSRWVTVISIAITLFLMNTGLLNPLAEQFWVPIRQHLENLIPLGDRHPPGGNAQNGGAARAQGADAVNAGQQREPDPAITAARLVLERRQHNANWLMNQARRLERAGLLFLASIAPGVAERHIAHLEAEARAERRRQEDAEAAAAAAAQAENAEQNQDSGNATGAGESGNQAEPAGGEGAENAAEPRAAGEPLIAV